MPRANAISATCATCSAVMMPPVGLAGELRMIRRVRSLTRPASSSTSNPNSFSMRSGIGTALAPAKWIIDS